MCRFVNDEGKVVERFLGLQHVESCTTIALKDSLVGMLSSHNLSICMRKDALLAKHHDVLLEKIENGEIMT